MRANTNTKEIDELPNGPFAASMLAMGLGCFTLGLATVLTEASPHMVKPWMNFYNPVGPLSGKSTVAIIVYFLSWAILASLLKRKNIKLRIWMTSTALLMGFSFLMTFPLFYQLFTVK